MSRIEVDEKRLKRDISAMQAAVREIRLAADETDGDLSDQLTDICADYARMLERISDAADEYGQCEEAVCDMVRRVQV